MEIPVKNIQLQAGHGVAGTGSGHIEVDTGGMELTVGFRLEIPPIGGKLELPGASVNLGPFGTIDIPGAEVTLPTITFPVLEFEFPIAQVDFGGFSVTFTNASFCLAVPINCTANREAIFVESSEEINNVFTSFAGDAFFTESESVESSFEIVFPASLTDAEAELIAMSDGTLTVERESRVGVSSTAQQNLRAMTAVNATTAVVANALNVANTGRIKLQTTGIGAFKLNQGNIFIQRR